MNGINLEKHFALTSSKFVQEICNPLLTSIGITYFYYIKIYNKDQNQYPEPLGCFAGLPIAHHQGLSKPCPLA